MNRSNDASLRLQQVLGGTERFATVCLAYEKALQEGERSVQKRCQEADLQYCRTLQQVQAEAQKRSEEAYREYGKVLQEGRQREDPREFQQQAYTTCMDKIREAHESAQDRIREAHQIYIGKIREARKHGQRLSHEAYRDYLRSLQDVWKQLDVDAVADAYALASANAGGY